MPKKIFAVTNVKIGPDDGQFFEAGQEVDHTKFTKSQLVELNEAGAIEVREVDAEAPDPVENASSENPAGQPAGQPAAKPEGSTENE